MRWLRPKSSGVARPPRASSTSPCLRQRLLATTTRPRRRRCRPRCHGHRAPGPLGFAKHIKDGHDPCRPEDRLQDVLAGLIQVSAVADVMATTGPPLALAKLEARFTARSHWRERLQTILDTLEALSRPKDSAAPAQSSGGGPAPKTITKLAHDAGVGRRTMQRASIGMLYSLITELAFVHSRTADASSMCPTPRRPTTGTATSRRRPRPRPTPKLARRWLAPKLAGGRR